MATINKTGRPKHCDKNMQRMYIRKGTKNRKWIAIGYYCSVCTKMIRNVDVLMHKGRETILSRQDSVNLVPNPQVIILDIGEKLTKVGFGGEKEPRFIFDTTLYFDENSGSFVQKSDYIETSRTVNKQVPIFDEKDNSNLNTEVLELFLSHVFELLEINIKDKSIIVIEKNYKNNYVEFLYGRREEINNSTLPADVKEKLKEKKKFEYVDYDKYVNFPRRQLTPFLFDSFGISRVYFSNGELLSLYANAMVTGLVVNIGLNTTRIIPVYDGFIVTHAISVRNIGTKKVLQKIIDHFNLEEDSNRISNHSKYLGRKRLRLASEEYCYVAPDIKLEENRWIDNEKMKKHIYLFEDKYIVLDQIRYLATEAILEKEELSTSKRKGTLVDAIIETIQKCDKDLVKDFYGNILLTGGGAFFEGLDKRIKSELKNKISDKIDIKINVKQNRLVSSWIGGSILSSLKTFNKLWVTKEEYDAKGSSAVDRCI